MSVRYFGYSNTFAYPSQASVTGLLKLILFSHVTQYKSLLTLIPIECTGNFNNTLGNLIS